MNKAILAKDKGRRYILPRGFHIVNDLVPLFELKQKLIKEQLLKNAKLRLKWIDYYKQCGNVSKTCRYYGISRETFYLWWRRYDPRNLLTLEDKDKTPHQKRQRDITPEQEEKIIALRKQYIRYGKIKLAKLYKDKHNEKISSWKVQKVIEKYKLYYNSKKTAKIAGKRKGSIKKKRITELKKKAKKSGFLLCLDTIVIYWNGVKRYIFTAIDHYSKKSFAWMYSNKSSASAEDFLLRLMYLWKNKIDNIQTDNGSEFHGMFLKACERLGIIHYWSRVKTPKDNPVNERFNRTLQEEFIQLGNFNPDLQVFNPKVIEWLIEYNFRRPHQALGYKTPIEATCGETQLSGMYSSYTRG